MACIAKSVYLKGRESVKLVALKRMDMFEPGEIIKWSHLDSGLFGGNIVILSGRE